MTREELIELGYKIKTFKGNEIEHCKLLNLFSNNVPHPNGSSLFYWTENYNSRKDNISEYNATVEEIVDKCLSYKPIIL
jgi:hypothetical protein